MRFEWAPEKDKANRAKHGVSFVEASGLFRPGVEYLTIYDVEHSSEEDRFITIGAIERGVVVVIYTERDDDVIRIFSARMATRKERQLYEEFLGERHER